MTIRALVIDDDFVMREASYQRLLEGGEARFEIECVELTRQAIEEACGRCHVALVDIVLTVEEEWEAFKLKDGTHVLDLIEVANPRMPVFIVSDKWDKANFPPFREMLRRPRVAGGIAVQGLRDPGLCAAQQAEIVTVVRAAWGLADLDLGPDEDLVIMHVSDPQFGGRWAMKEDAADAADLIVTQMFDALPRTRRQRLAPHILVVTGDIAEHGQPEEFQAGLRILDRLRDRWLGIPRRHCFIVPGNHDVNMALACSPMIRYSFGVDIQLTGREANPTLIDAHSLGGLSGYGLAPFEDFCRAFTNRDDWRLTLDDLSGGTVPWFVSTLFMAFGVNIIGINTVSGQGPRSPSLASFSSRHISDLSHMLKKLQENPLYPEQGVNLVLLHHSPFREDGAEPGKDNLGEDGPRLAGALSQRGDCIFLFGHIHDVLGTTRGFTPQDPVPSALVVTASSPTLGATSKPEDSLRGFNLVHLHRSSDVVTGARVQNYAYQGQKFLCLQDRHFRRDDFGAAREGKGWALQK